MRIYKNFENGDNCVTLLVYEYANPKSNDRIDMKT